jgi:hypothetical protein
LNSDKYLNTIGEIIYSVDFIPSYDSIKSIKSIEETIEILQFIYYWRYDKKLME